MSKRNVTMPAQTEDGFDINTPLETTGIELKTGLYPAVFVGFGGTVSFTDKATGEVKDRLSINFALKVGQETMPLSDMVSFPIGGQVHRKSKLHRLLKAIGHGNRELWDSTKDGVAKGVTLAAFQGQQVTLSISRSVKGFDKIGDFLVARPKAVYPSEEEMSALPPF